MGAYCLRSAYAVFERVLTPKIEARKLLFYFYFFTHSFTLPDLTSAFGGQRSIQLSYGCFVHLMASGALSKARGGSPVLKRRLDTQQRR